MNTSGAELNGDQARGLARLLITDRRAGELAALLLTNDQAREIARRLLRADDPGVAGGADG